MTGFFVLEIEIWNLFQLYQPSTHSCECRNLIEWARFWRDSCIRRNVVL